MSVQIVGRFRRLCGEEREGGIYMRKDPLSRLLSSRWEVLEILRSYQ